MDKSSSLGMPMSPQEISKRYKRQSLGIPKASPFSSTKYQVIFLDAIFLLLHMLCVVLGAFYFCFVCCIPSYFFWRMTHSIFIAQNTLVFTLIVLRVFSFASTAFSSGFPLVFCSELVSFLQLGMISSLVFIDYYL